MLGAGYIHLRGSAVRRFVADSERNEAFIKIYDSTYQGVLHFVASKCQKPSDIADIVQNTYYNFYSRLCSKGLAHIKEPKRYLMRIARDELYRYYGTLAMLRRNVPVFSQGEILPQEELQFLADNSMEDKLDAAELWERISQKDETTVAILTLYFVSDLKISEIAKRIGEKESFVKNRLYRTIRELKAEFAEQGSENT